MLTRRLLDRFQERGFRICRLEVQTANAFTIDLDERLGFRVIGNRPGYSANEPTRSQW
jgi:ribosomal protein S18 acetylase RimI-like enzyme